ncbi:hypothetical protein AMATHDRAFT_143188 [Amanita thiersii Skay4041]|uniref:Protein-S-isoprenylcysteine O-methyltransferase n=1 Tax=Amanita thiersii Skay4041 TaxID=703135 RepID=A0A2A9NU07_9AGAR|nr:hypothetical protein AMATHDRAFT_143188 [Amanita thiersii Skay4041]
MFTIEVCLRKDHKLITHGPYSVVRHPSYSGGLIAIVGALIWFWGPGSFLRETDTTATRILGFVVTTTVIWPCFLIPNRVKSEDEALQKAFGAEWESWAQRVPYRLFPGIY